MYIQPGGFFAVMFIYFFLSVAWTGVSAYVFAGTAHAPIASRSVWNPAADWFFTISRLIFIVPAHRNNFGVKKLGIALGVWAGIALATSIVDLVFCSCLGADYNTVLDHYLEVVLLTKRFLNWTDLFVDWRCGKKTGVHLLYHRLRYSNGARRQRVRLVDYQRDSHRDHHQDFSRHDIRKSRFWKLFWHNVVF